MPRPHQDVVMSTSERVADSHAEQLFVVLPNGIVVWQCDACLEYWIPGHVISLN